jgi:hypothetical protein
MKPILLVLNHQLRRSIIDRNALNGLMRAESHFIAKGLIGLKGGARSKKKSRKLRHSEPWAFFQHFSEQLLQWVTVCTLPFTMDTVHTAKIQEVMADR